MELSQFKGSAEIGAVVRHIGTTLSTGERLLPADGSTINPAAFPRLSAFLKTNVRTLAVRAGAHPPLVTNTTTVTNARFIAADLPNNYMLCGNSGGSSGYAVEISGGAVTTRTFGGNGWGLTRPSFSQNRLKKVIPMNDGGGRVMAVIGVNGEVISSLPLREVESSVSDAAGNVTSLMRTDGSNCLIFCGSTNGPNFLNVYSCGLATASAAWVRAQRTITGGSNNLSGEAYGNATLSTVVLGVSDGSLLRSTDGAASFTRIFPNLSSTSSQLKGFVAHPDTATALCRQGDNLLITADGWNTSLIVPPFAVPEASGGVYLVSAGIEEGSRNIYAMYHVALTSGVTYVLLRSTDHGVTWSDPIIIPMMRGPSVDYSAGRLLIPSNPSFLYAVTSAGDLHRIDCSTGLILPYLEGRKVIADRT